MKLNLDESLKKNKFCFRVEKLKSVLKPLVKFYV